MNSSRTVPAHCAQQGSFSCGHRTRPDRAFTLIELLTVIAIIGILAAIAIPAIGTIRKNADAGLCQSNLRQIGLASALYEVENRNLMPYPLPGGVDGPTEFWIKTVPPLMTTTVKTFEVREEGNRPALACPSQNKIRQQQVHYAMNGALRDQDLDIRINKLRLLASPNRGDRPDRLVITAASVPYFLCGFYEGAAGFRTNRFGNDSRTVEESFPHSDACNVVFLDGHVERKDRMSPLFDSNLRPQYHNTPTTLQFAW